MRYVVPVLILLTLLRLTTELLNAADGTGIDPEPDIQYAALKGK